MKRSWRARAGAICAAAGVVLIGMGVTSQPATAAVNSLANWSKQGATGAGTWVLSQDGNSVRQTINGAPTFFVSPFLKESATFTVDITPAQSSDNDYVGVVLGYTDPVDDATCGSQNCDNSYILFDWKQEDELGEQAGYSLIRVNGSYDVRDPNSQLPCFWDHTDTATCDVLAQSLGGTQGWTEGAANRLRFTYGPGSIKVERIANTTNAATTIFDVTGTFPTGRIGLYNYSQADVLYAVNDLADPTAPSTSSSSTSSTSTSTTAVPASTTTTALRATIVRTGPTDAAGIQVLLGTALVALGGVLFASRGKRPEGAFYQ